MRWCRDRYCCVAMLTSSRAEGSSGWAGPVWEPESCYQLVTYRRDTPCINTPDYCSNNIVTLLFMCTT